MRTLTIPLAVLFTTMLVACDDPEEPEFGDDDDVSMREVHPCLEHAAKIPVDYAARMALFKKVSLITTPAVVGDPCRTKWDAQVWLNNKCPVNTQGVWTFWYLMSQMAGSGDPSEFIFKTLESFETATPVNEVPLNIRAGIRTKVIDPWREASGCAKGKKWVDDKCPLKPEELQKKNLMPVLLALVNRIDMRPSMDGQNNCGYYKCQDMDSQAGEGRFVFGFNGIEKINNVDVTKAIEATMILEYALPTTVFWTRVHWANAWLELNNYNYDATYLTKLQAITDKFSKKNVFAGKQNQGSAIKSVRTNERAFDTTINKVWSLRAFKLDPNCGGCTNAKLVPQPLEQTPRNMFQDDEKRLLPFLDDNTLQILQGKHVVPEDLDGENFIGGESMSQPLFDPNPFIWAWNLMIQGKLQDGLSAPDTRRLFAIATCNGCHYKETENLNNMHIANPAIPGQEAKISSFLKESPYELSTVFNKSGIPVSFDEPRRRLCELYQTQSGAGKVLSNHFGGHN